MKAFKIFGLCLIAGAMLSGSRCSRPAKRGPMDKVAIVTDCKPSEDPVEVILGDTVKWDFGPPSSHSYAVHFKHRTPFLTKDPPITEKNKIKGDSLCSGTLGLLCYYEYVITKDGGKPCVDPGVHVGDGGP